MVLSIFLGGPNPRCGVANESDTTLLGFAQAFGIVSGAAVGLATIAVVVARLFKFPLLPRWRVLGAVWPGGVVVGLFLTYYVAMPSTMLILDQVGAYQKLCGPEFPPLRANAPPKADETAYAKWSGENQLRAIWAGFIVVPVLVALTVYLRFVVLNQSPSLTEFTRPLPGRLALGVWFGLALVPMTFGVHALTVWVAESSGVNLDRHPLTALTPAGDGYGGWVFALSVIVAGPIIEELLFRGLVVNWASHDWHRPWVVLMFAGLLAAMRGTQFVPEFGPMVFIALLGVGLYLMQRFALHIWPRFPTRTVAAVWSSAALFAAAHASIWPSPIPLFVLGLGLGFLTALTRDISAAVVVHGMFNAVSFVYLLRGGVG